MNRRNGTIARTIVVALGAMVVLASAAPAEAGKKNFMSVLNGGQEVPAVASTGIGVMYGTFDPETDMFCFALSWSGLLTPGTETDAHIHGPDVPFTKHPMNIIFPLTAPFTSPMNQCVGPLTGEQASFLKKGLLYVNVHTAAHTAGEIRGQIVPVKGK